MGNRLVLNLLGSAEAILIPSRLIDYGLTNKEALSIYGVLTSMALPFILFPSALTNSMAVLLLPSAAKAQAEKDESRISTMVTLSFRYSCYMGILCIGLLPGLAKALARSFSIMSCPALLLWYFAGSVRLCIWQLLWEASKMALENGYYLPAKYVCHGDPSGICAVCSAAVWYPGIFMGLSGQRTAFSLFMLFFCPPSGGISLQYGRLRFKAGAGALISLGLNWPCVQLFL